MGTVSVPNERKIPAFAAAALLVSSLSLGECATATAGSSLLDARAQAAPPKASIFDPPPPREKPAMTLDERLKLFAQCRPLNPRSPSSEPDLARTALAPIRRFPAF
jgi:hypothetical protein